MINFSLVSYSRQLTFWTTCHLKGEVPILWFLCGSPQIMTWGHFVKTCTFPEKKWRLTNHTNFLLSIDIPCGVIKSSLIVLFLIINLILFNPNWTVLTCHLWDNIWDLFEKMNKNRYYQFLSFCRLQPIFSIYSVMNTNKWTKNSLNKIGLFEENYLYMSWSKQKI